MKIIINEKQYQSLINEFINSDVSSFKRYLSSDDEVKMGNLPYDYAHLVYGFLKDKGLKVPNIDNMEDYEVIEWMEKNKPDFFKKFGDYILNGVKNYNLPIDTSEYPAWAAFDDKPEVIKNQWLIHLTDDADSIAQDGFKYGVDEIERLGYTKYMSSQDKKYGGYNFAYLIHDFAKYGMTSRGFSRARKYKYGQEAVIFRASGVRVWHHGDEEYQTIFRGDSATNIIPVKEGENKEWAIYNKKTGRIVVEMDNLDDIAYWVEKNYTQYSKSISESLELNEMAYPTSFSMDEFKKIRSFNGRIRYCEEHLDRISSGSGRVVYKIDNHKVLKLAKNEKGVAQNGAEYQIGKYDEFSIVAKIYDSDENLTFIEMELAKKVSLSDFKRIVGFNPNQVHDYVHNTVIKPDTYVIEPEIEDAMDNNEWIVELCDMIGSTQSLPGDLGRLSTYGIVNRGYGDEIVLIDFGLTKSVYTKYYKRHPW